MPETNARNPDEYLLGTERVARRGLDYALRHRTEGGFEALRVRPGAVENLGSRHDRTEAIALVEADAAARSDEVARRYRPVPDAVIDDVRPGVAAMARAAGLAPWNTGGGCMAWGRRLDDGGQVLVTYREAGLDGDPAHPAWIVGRHGPEEGFVAIDRGMPLAEAIAAADILPAPIDANGEARESTVQDPTRFAALLAEYAEDRARTVARMGYEGILKASSVFSEGVLYEVALIGPGGPYGEKWSVAVHQNCDPDEPTAGCSSLDDHATLAEGEAAWREAIKEVNRLQWAGYRYG